MSPSRRKSSIVSNSLRPLRLVPDAFSARMTVQPAALSAARCMGYVLREHGPWGKRADKVIQAWLARRAETKA